MNTLLVTTGSSAASACCETPRARAAAPIDSSWRLVAPEAVTAVGSALGALQRGLVHRMASALRGLMLVKGVGAALRLEEQSEAFIVAIASLTCRSDTAMGCDDVTGSDVDATAQLTAKM